jgi:hypothetical protein
VALPRPTLALGTLACVALLALAAPVGAGVSGPAKVRLATKPAGSYKPSLNLTLLEGESKVRYVKVHSTADHKQDATLTEVQISSGGPAYITRWFKGRRNITQAVGQGGFAFVLRQDAVKRFRVRIKAPVGADPICLIPSVDVQPDDVGSGATFFINGATQGTCF